eukprot:scpid98745/ scgid28636/ 
MPAKEGHASNGCQVYTKSNSLSAMESVTAAIHAITYTTLQRPVSKSQPKPALAGSEELSSNTMYYEASNILKRVYILFFSPVNIFLDMHICKINLSLELRPKCHTV